MASPGSVVVYERAGLEDADLRILGQATVTIKATVGANHPISGDAATLLPDEVLSVEDPGVAVALQASPSVACGSNGSITLALWLADAMIVVKCRRLVLEAVQDSWVERVLGDSVRRENNGGLGGSRSNDTADIERRLAG